LNSSSSNQRRFSPIEVSVRNKTATWLSPLPQPSAYAAPNSQVPSDSTLRKFIGKTAMSLENLVNENVAFFGEIPEKSFNAYPLIAAKGRSDEAVPETVERSVSNSPINVPWEIPSECVTPSLQFSPTTGMPQAGTLRYTWLERGFLCRDDEKIHEGVYSLQIRHHSKLEAYHEMRRPVYCINLKSDSGDFVNLRLLMLLHTEMPFLTRAAKHFTRKGDFSGGAPVVDHHGRCFVDDQVIRRAAFCYAEFQRIRLIEGKPIGTSDEPLSDELRYAHFLVFRSHLPELAAPQVDISLSASSVQEMAPLQEAV
jgi:hypothetical protein